MHYQKWKDNIPFDVFLLEDLSYFGYIRRKDVKIIEFNSFKLKNLKYCYNWLDLSKTTVNGIEYSVKRYKGNKFEGKYMYKVEHRSETNYILADNLGQLRKWFNLASNLSLFIQVDKMRNAWTVKDQIMLQLDSYFEAVCPKEFDRFYIEVMPSYKDYIDLYLKMVIENGKTPIKFQIKL